MRFDLIKRDTADTVQNLPLLAPQTMEEEVSPDMALPISDESSLYTHRFTDDQVEFAQNKKDLKYIRRKLKEELNSGG